MSNSYSVAGEINAINTRKQLGYDSTVPINIFDILVNEYDVLLLFKPMDADFSGMFIRYKGEQAILINTDKSLGHQRFTAAHELYHLLYDDKLSASVCNVGRKSKDIREKKADWFATHFLMPEYGITAWVRENCQNRELTIIDIVELEQYYKVSHAAMLFRLENLGFITQSQREKLSKGIISRAMSLGYEQEEIQLYLPTREKNVSSNYKKTAMIAYEIEQISEGKLKEILTEAGINVSFMDKNYSENIVKEEGCIYDFFS